MTDDEAWNRSRNVALPGFLPRQNYAQVETLNVLRLRPAELCEVPDESLETLVKAFRKRGVAVSIPKLIEVDSKKCINCGACITLCPVEAIIMDEDASVVFNKEKCLGSTCSACVDACPSRAVKSVKQNNIELTANNSH